MIYLKEICKRIDNEEITWYFNDFDERNHETYMETLIECGFKGDFATFNISNEEVTEIYE